MKCGVRFMLTQRDTTCHHFARSVQPPIGFAALRLAVCCAMAWTAIGEENRSEHPLLPGVRSAEVWNPEWPSTMHDKLLTGFSPLNCGMRESPRLWATIHTGGEAASAAFLPDEQGKTFLLVQDSALR